MKRTDLIGRAFGSLLVVSSHGVDAKGHQLVRALCGCNDVTVVRADNLLSGHTKSCGCRRGTKPKPT